MKISICMGSSCFARGNEANLRIIESYIKENGNDIDVDLRGSRCEGLCSEGPIIRVGEKLYKNVDSGTMLDILAQNFSK
jgi:NADH:ubiquinone oxidoreductase subunit E